MRRDVPVENEVFRALERISLPRSSGLGPNHPPVELRGRNTLPVLEFIFADRKGGRVEGP